MTVLELQEQRLNLQTELTNIINESETRSLEEAETSKLAEIRSQIDSIDAQIEEINKANENIAKQERNNINTNKSENTMSLLKMINTVAEGRNFDEATAQEIANAKGEMRKAGLTAKGQIVLRTITAQDATHGQENVPEEKMGLEMAIRNNLVASKIGASWLGNVTGDVSIPTYAGSEVKWKGETATADAGDGEFGEVVLTPHRLTATIDISKQFLAQDSNDAEALLINDLAAAVAEKLDKTIFGDGEGTTEQPAGLFYAVGAGDEISGATYDHVLNLELGCEEANAGDFVFVANPKVKYALKGTQMASGLQMVYEGGEIDGYPAFVSNSVQSKGILALDPKSLVVAQWDGIDITVDPYTKAADGQVRIVVNAYFDAKMKSNRIAKYLFA